MIPEAWRLPLEQAMEFFDIDTPERKSMFLAQVAHESGGFRRIEESLNYSPQRLLAVWPKRFTPAEAVEFAHDPVRIAERAYGGRNGNGPEGMGDGYLYRGRGLIQLTGRANYRRCGNTLGLPLEERPDMVLEPHTAALSAAWFWDDKGCNALADAGKFEAITRAINGGLNGHDDRLAWLAKFKRAV